MKLDHKKLPNGWAYIVSIRQIKELVRQAEADVRIVEFTGTGGRPCKLTPGLYSGANLDARVDGGQWCYRFRFHGLPEEVLPSDRGNLAELVLADIADFVSRPSGETLDTTILPEHRIMFFRFADGRLSHDFSTKKQDKMDDKIETRSRNRWWEKTAQPVNEQ